MMIMDRIVDLELAKAHNAAILAECTQLQAVNRELRSDVAARLRFFRLYRLRRFFYRLIPGLAERLAL